MATNASNNGSANGTETTTYRPKFSMDELLAHGWKLISKDVFPYYVSLHALPVASDRSKAAAAPADRHIEGSKDIVPYPNYRMHFPTFRAEMEKRGIDLFCTNMTMELDDEAQTDLHTFGTQVSLDGLRIKATDNPLDIWKNIPTSLWDTVHKTFIKRRNNDKENCTENLLWRVMFCRTCIQIGHYTLVSPDITEIQIFGCKFEPKYAQAVRECMEDGAPSRCERKKRELRMKREYGLGAQLRLPVSEKTEELPLGQRPLKTPVPKYAEGESLVPTTVKSVVDTNKLLYAALSDMFAIHDGYRTLIEEARGAVDELRKAVTEAKEHAAAIAKLKTSIESALRPPTIRGPATTEQIIGTNGEPVVPMNRVTTIQETNRPAFAQNSGAR